MAGPEEVAACTWEQVFEDVDDLARLELGIRRRIRDADFEDIKQSVKYQLLRHACKDREVLCRFADRNLRRAFISTALRFAAAAWRRQAWRRRVQTVETIEPHLVDPRSPFDRLAITDSQSLTARLIAEVPVRSDARFVMEHFLLGVSIEEFAQANGISIRTAYRRFRNGLRELRARLETNEH